MSGFQLYIHVFSNEKMSESTLSVIRDNIEPALAVPKPRVCIQHLGDQMETILRKGFTFLGRSGEIHSGSRIAIKPNLTFPVFRKGVMTNPEILEALILYFKNYTDNITVCESDSGGYNRFSMDEVFSRTGISEFSKRHGIRIVNMSYSPSRRIGVNTRWRTLQVPLPAFLLDETDIFVTIPVPKVHCNTVVSLAMKNQWGVIQQPELRLKLHPYFKEVIHGINKALPRPLAIVDGKYGLNRSGPLRGDVVDLNWILVSDNIFATDLVVSEIMGFDWQRIPYLSYAFKREGVCSLKDIAFNTDLRDYKTAEFHMEREWTDYPGVMTFNSRFLAYLGYESLLAKPLHWLLYRFREPFY